MKLVHCECPDIHINCALRLEVIDPAQLEVCLRHDVKETIYGLFNTVPYFLHGALN